MKKLIFISLAIFVSCSSEKFEISKARVVAENAIVLIHARNYSDLANLYSEDFKTSESPEVRENKFNQIVYIMGEVEKITIQDSVNITANANGEPTLKYKIETKKVTVIESFSFVQEDADYKIAGIDVQQTKK